MLGQVAWSLASVLSFGSLFCQAETVSDDSSDSGVSIGDCTPDALCSPVFDKQVYATTKPVFDREMTELLFPGLIADQGDDTLSCGTGCKYIFTDSCTRIHQPSTYHQEFNLKVSYVEEQVTAKWAHVMDTKNDAQYDSFLDNNVAFWTNDVTGLFRIWTQLEHVDVVILRWYADVDKTRAHPFYSVITHHPGTTSQYEIISDTLNVDFDALETQHNVVVVDSEPRAHFSREELDDYRSAMSDCTLYPIGARRSVTSVDENVAWYQMIFEATLTEEAQVITGEAKDYKGDVVKYAHIRVEASEHTDSTTVSFFERSERSTYGELSVKDFENGMNEAHDLAVMSPYCGIDRWFDNHYAMSLNERAHALSVLKSAMTSGGKYSVYLSDPSGVNYFLYINEPNGHSLQIVFEIDDLVWYFEPELWDNDWCPMSCTEGKDLIKFGQDVFDFEASMQALATSKQGHDADEVEEADEAEDEAEDKELFGSKSGLDVAHERGYSNTTLLAIFGALVGMFLIRSFGSFVMKKFFDWKQTRQANEYVPLLA